ncbi:MAG: hypothetical protein IT517_18365 [Burkholderiales bacterium]|nr:hypothetical protein [Burkholderiales bacterium]
MIRTPTTSPKVTPPRLHGVVDRQRLFARIDLAAPPVVWIAGPPGAGKTTLAASYVNARKRPAIWYRVDSGDTDCANFFRCLGDAAARIPMRRGEPLPRLAAESSGNPGAFARTYFRVLFARLPAKAVVVLDNYQDAAGAPFEAIVRDALEEVPDGRRVIVTCHTDPPNSCARLQAGGKLEQIRSDELLLTPDESRAILSVRTGFDERMHDALHAYSGGWAAGLVLMAEHARRGGVVSVLEVASSREAVFDYFAGEILARETAADRRTLLLSATARRLTGRLAQIMTGDPGATHLLERMYRRHLFTDRRQGPEVTYHYHDLFRDFLRTCAAHELTDEERAEAVLRVARTLEADGYRDGAVASYLDARDVASVTRLVLCDASRLHAQGRSRTLMDWIGALPPQAVVVEPWLAYWAGACEVWASPASARVRLQQAFDGFAAAGDRNGQVLAMGAITRACILSANWAPLDHALAELCVLLDGDDGRALAPATRLAGLSRLVYAALTRHPQHPRLPAWAARTTAELGAATDANDAVMAGFSLMHYYYVTGSTAGQEGVIRRVDPLLADPAITATTRCYWLWARSGFVLRTDSPMSALALIDDAVALAESHGLAIATVLRRYRVGHLLTVASHARAATELAALESARRVEPYYEMRAWLALQRGDLPAALHEARTATQMAEERGRTYYRILDGFLLALVLAESDAHDDARAAIAEYRQETAGVQWPLAEYHALLVDAYIALRAGARDACVAPLRLALAIGERERYRSHWFWHPAMMARLYGEALERGIAVAYVREVIRTHALLPAAPDIPGWPWAVAVRTLGEFSVEVRGTPLRFEGKAQRKPLELLKALVAMGGHDVPAHALIEFMWPEPLEDGGQKALEITVHRLRRLLASDDAIVVTDRRVTLDAAHVWVDAWTLERMLADLVGTPGGSEPAMEVLAAAAPRVLELYRGEFLTGERDARWLLPVRNRIAGRFARIVLRLGAHWEAQEQWAQALGLYARATELDVLGEAFYQRQMVCLHRMGRRAEAIDVYRRCRQMLSVVLGVAPAAETEAIHRQLRVDEPRTRRADGMCDP